MPGRPSPQASSRVKVEMSVPARRRRRDSPLPVRRSPKRRVDSARLESDQHRQCRVVSSYSQYGSSRYGALRHARCLVVFFFVFLFLHNCAVVLQMRVYMNRDHDAFCSSFFFFYSTLRLCLLLHCVASRVSNCGLLCDSSRAREGRIRKQN